MVMWSFALAETFFMRKEILGTIDYTDMN